MSMVVKSIWLRTAFHHPRSWKSENQSGSMTLAGPSSEHACEDIIVKPVVSGCFCQIVSDQIIGRANLSMSRVFETYFGSAGASHSPGQQLTRRALPKTDFAKCNSGVNSSSNCASETNAGTKPACVTHWLILFCRDVALIKHCKKLRKGLQ